MRVPKYRHWKTRNKGFSEHQGRRIYFPGAHNSPESLQAYQAWLVDIQARNIAQASPESLTMADLAVAYLRHCQTYYGDKPRGTIVNIKAAIREVVRGGWSEVHVVDFGPKTLKAIQQAMIDKGLARVTINDRTSWIKAWLKWAASEELVPISVYQAVATTRGLAKGRTSAKEMPPRSPVSWESVQAVLPELSQVVKDMVLLQWHTGARSGSICQAHSSQFSPDPHDSRLLLWRPRHKTEWRGKELVIPIGPQAQMIILWRLSRCGWLFSPKEASGSPRAGEVYTPWAYRKAVSRAQVRAGVRPWTPHQLRHSKAHEVRERWGAEAVQAVLGHDQLKTSEVYSSRRLQLAREIALEAG